MADENGAPQAASAEVVAFAEDGRIVVAGDPTTVDRLIAELKPDRELDLATIAPLATGVGGLLASTHRGGAARYVELGAQRWKGISTAAHPDRFSTEFREVTRHLPSGRIVSNRPVTPDRAALALQPEVLIAMAAMQMALQAVTEAVEAVARDVDDLKRIAETTEVGNLAGLYRVLANAREQVDATGTLARTTWESVATHEVLAQQGADRLRAFLRRTVDALPVEASAGERLDEARRLLCEGTIDRSLKLLILAEQCRLLWRSLKLDRIREVEPGLLDAEAASAKRLLQENAEADKELVESLREVVDKLTRTGPIDGLRIWSRSELPAAEAQLRSHIDSFATSRSQQFDSWAPDKVPTLGDAAREVGEIANRAAVEGRRAVGGVIAGFGSWVQGSQDDPKAVEARPSDGESS